MEGERTLVEEQENEEHVEGSEEHGTVERDGGNQPGKALVIYVFRPVSSLQRTS